jgi:hypothetical protein
MLMAHIEEDAMPATSTGRGAQVIIDPGSDTEKAIRGAYASSIEANTAKVRADVAAGVVADGYGPDGTTRTASMATDTAVNPMGANNPLVVTGNGTVGGTLTVTGAHIISQGAGGNPSISAYDTTTSGGRGFWIDPSQNMGFGPTSSAGAPTAQQMALTAAGGLQVQLGIGAFNATPPSTKPAVTGSKGANAALASLLTALVAYGLVTDSST